MPLPKQSNPPWKSVAITLALVLVIVLVCVALVMTDVMKLANSLL